MEESFKTAPHNPPHWFLANATYMLTATIYQHRPLMRSPQRKLAWRDAFFHAAKAYRWHIEAWVVLDDHYHSIVTSPENPSSLSRFIASYHKYTARRWNEEDHSIGRKVWWNYWDTCLHSEEEHIRRLRYVFWNPVKHGLANAPESYPYSNYQEYIQERDRIDFTGIDEV